MSKHVEKRKFTRRQVAMRVEVRLDCGVLIEGKARNVSLNGLFLETERSLPLGSRVRVKMVVSDPLGETHVDCTGVVSRLDGHGVAIELVRFAEEHIEHLEHIIYHRAPEQTLKQTEPHAAPQEQRADNAATRQ